MPRLLLIGGFGRLGSAIETHTNVEYKRFSRQDLDITKPKEGAWSHRGWRHDDIIINCAGVLALESNSNHEYAWAVNAVGAGNVAMWATKMALRCVHISTDAVFSGYYGMYMEHDAPNPVNYFGLTKAAGEAAVTAANPDALIIRAPFRYDGPWLHEAAFIDAWRSSRWLSEVAPDIIEAAINPALTGILHMGGRRRSVYEMAREVTPDVLKIQRSSFIQFEIPRDTSLDSTRWNEYKAAKAVTR